GGVKGASNTKGGKEVGVMTIRDYIGDCSISDEIWDVSTLSGIVREGQEKFSVVLSTSELGTQSSSSEVEP
ncbi:hypothetical protein KI387_011664, partial [Taxus chinensis]